MNENSGWMENNSADETHRETFIAVLQMRTVIMMLNDAVSFVLQSYSGWAAVESCAYHLRHVLASHVRLFSQLAGILWLIFNRTSPVLPSNFLPVSRPTSQNQITSRFISCKSRRRKSARINSESVCHSADCLMSLVVIRKLELPLVASNILSDSDTSNVIDSP